MSHESRCIGEIGERFIDRRHHYLADVYFMNRGIELLSVV